MRVLERCIALLLLVPFATNLANDQFPFVAGENAFPIRGVPQEVYYLPASNTERGVVLFVPGDAGWRGFAISVANRLSESGYNVVGLDTRYYLESFTGATVLTEAQIAGDMKTLADAVRGERRVILLGWSQGAGMLAVAAAAPEKRAYEGFIAAGLGDDNVLGWRLADYLTYLTGKTPDEPTFSVFPYLPEVSPLPLVMIQSSHDRYTSRAESNRLFSAAAEPKRFILVPARNHRYDGARTEFFRELEKALSWVEREAPKQ